MKKILIAFIQFCLISISGNAQQQDPLYKEFVTPPNSAKPRVWWHWMSGNITQDGIRKDLLWMNRSGIGGFQNFDASMMVPQIVSKPLAYMTPEWKQAFSYTTKLADSLKLEMAIAGSPGWSETGGPWVKAEDGMKKLVWTETFVKGGATGVSVRKPEATTGPIQNASISTVVSFESPVTVPSFYKDIAVIAYKLPTTDVPLSELKPKVTSSGGNFHLSQLTDGDLNKTSLLLRDSVNGFAWIQFEFDKPTSIQALTIFGGGDRGPFGLLGELKDTRALELSEDGKSYKQVCFIPASNVLQQTISFAPITSKYFRVTFKNPPLPINLGAMVGAGGSTEPPAGTDVAEIALHTGPRINWFEEKAAFAPAMDLNSKITPPSTNAIQYADVIDLTEKLKSDGTLEWKVPTGNWNIVRFGYSLIGKNNHPATPEATGLEVDKLDPAAIKRYFTHYLDSYKSATNGLMGEKGGLQFMVTDSWEAGAQNWTGNMMAEFKKRRGYDLTPWMPVLTGRVVKSTDASEQFLFDFRNTLSEMVAEYHYDGLTTILNDYGMKRYSESHEDKRAMIADGMDVKRTAAIPMSAMWTKSLFINQGNLVKYEADIRESASVAHIYGQNLVAAESLTALGFPNSAWSYSPENLKPIADLELANGLNRFVIHTSVHQPVDDKIPGFGLGPFGQWFTRHETWAENAKAWTNYLARSSYMLQQGKFVADLLIYYGEDNNITSLYANKLPEVPEGYNYDFINPHALINLVSVKDGKLITPSGMQYSVLVLDDNAKKMTLAVLRKIAALVKAGATVTGVKPEMTSSLMDDQNEFNRLVAEIWSGSNSNVTIRKSFNNVLSSLNIAPDFGYTKPNADTKLLYVHRKATDRDIYWVNSRTENVEDLELTFRISGKVPELWFADSGITEPLSYRIENGLTKVKLHMEPNDALFVVFKDAATKSAIEIPMPIVSELATIQGAWDVSFQKDRGAPASTKMNELKSWTENTDAGIRYFSGTASYSKSVNAPASWFVKDTELWLNLGDVKNLAEVIVNGKSLGVLWKKPFRINVTSALKKGDNKVEIKVTNLWVNRLIGDAQSNTEKKITFTTMPFYQANSPLLPSGLLGPVKVMSLNRK